MLLASFGILALSPDCLLIRLITVDTWTLVFWRGAFIALGLSVGLVAIHGGRIVEQFRVMGRAGIAASLIMGVGTLVFVMAIRTTSVANTLIITGNSPLIAALFSWVWLKERVELRTWLAIAAASVAVYITVSDNVASGNWLGDLYAGCGAVFVALHVVVARSVKHVSLVPSVAGGGVIVALLVLPYAEPSAVDQRDVLLLVLLGAIVLPVAFSLLTLAPRYITAPEVSLIKLTEMVLGPTWVWLGLGENPGREAMIGGGILLVTLVVHTALGRKA